MRGNKEASGRLCAYSLHNASHEPIVLDALCMSENMLHPVRLSPCQAVRLSHVGVFRCLRHIPTTVWPVWLTLTAIKHVCTPADQSTSLVTLFCN